MNNKKGESKKFKLYICEDCGLPGNCKDPKKCNQAHLSSELYGGDHWYNHHKKNNNDTYDEITHSYYTSWFTYLLGKGVDITRLVIVYPTRWFIFDVVPDAMFYALSLFEDHHKYAHEQLQKRKNKKITEPERKSFISDRDDDSGSQR